MASPKFPFTKIEFVDRLLALQHKKKRVDFMHKVFPNNGIGAELGVFKGHFSPFLFKYTKAKKLHLIDLWYLLAPKWTWAQGNQSTVDALRRILKIFKKEIESERVIIHVGDDIEILKSFPNNYFDWVYIDSSHAYDHTKQELLLLEQKVKPEGVISGDDWRPDKNHPHHGVFKAVTEFIADRDYQIIYADEQNLQWAIKQM
ncbi:class I SAM-dependent methyltransferase [uncultured Draconibacterium sp.]|uniref:class I SAM-dependent methyltransferase n=1 Tax=uncultured Draconibacterium sp. TaxID=1573823 RepID=UPI003217D72C